MTAYVALLRAVNVGGTGKLSMVELKALCEAAGFTSVKTYIAIGNVVFKSGASETLVKATLEKKLAAAMGKPVGVIVRTAEEMADAVARNPFVKKPSNLTVALFVDEPVSSAMLSSATGVDGEEMRAGKREIFIFYPKGQGQSRLRLPHAKAGTARNMNTVAKLAEMAAALG